MFSRLDVVSIGSATRDVFVYVPRNSMHNNELEFKPGAKIEIKDVAYSTGGGATNTSVAFSRLGLHAGVACAIGNDENGNEIIAELKRENVDASHCEKVRGMKTAYSVILTGFGRDRVVLAYTSASTSGLSHAKIAWEKIGPKWFYISSLHDQTRLLEKIISQAKKANAKVAFNPGQKELGLGLEGLVELVGEVNVLLVNKEEALKLTGCADIHRNLVALQRLARIVAITEGSRGAHVCGRENEPAYFMKPYDVPVMDVTGAGDAFGSGLTAAIIKGKDLKEALQWGTANASSVVTTLGTKNILLTERGIKGFIARHHKAENEVKEQKL